MTRPDTSSPEAIAQRKRQLLAEGTVYRASLASSLQEVRHSLRTDSLVKRAAGFIAATALGMVRARSGGIGGGLGAQSLLPLAIEAFSLLPKKSWLKRVLRIAAVVAAATGAVNMFMHKKKSPEQDSETEPAHQPQQGDAAV